MSGTLINQSLQVTQLYLWPLCWDSWQATHGLRRSLDEFVDYALPAQSSEAQLRWWSDEVETGRMLIYGLFNRHDDTLVGTLKAFSFSPDQSRCEIGIEILDPEQYAQGHGRQGLGLFLALLADQGVTSVYGLIHPDNQRSRRFFAARGFREAGLEPDPIDPAMVFVRVEQQLG